MTENERILDNLKATLCDMIEIIDFETEYDKERVKELDNDVSKIIDLLDELEECRAIGTVEGYKRAIEVSKENYYLYLEYKAKVQAFEAIGTIEEFKALKEKNVAKKVIYVSNKGVKTPHCPNCNMELTSGKYMIKFCNCEQKLNWQ